MNSDDRTCLDCPTVITKYSKTGRCLPCSSRARFADPVWRERHRASILAVAATKEYREARRKGTTRRFADPAARKAQSDARKAGLARNPEMLERMRAYVANELNAARDRANIDWKAHHQARVAEYLAWCPEDRRAEYKKLRATRGLTAAEAKRIMLDDIAAAERKRLAAMTPHERNMERVRQGATLTTKLDLRKPDPAFTLGGIATGAL